MGRVRFRRGGRGWGAALATAVLLGATTLALGTQDGDPRADGSTPPAWLSTFLTRGAGFPARDLRALAEGRVISRALDTVERREIAVVGAVRIEGTGEHLVGRLRDIVSFKKSDMVLQIARFSLPPTDADMAALVVDDEDLEDLRTCRAGDCGVRLSAAAIREIVPAASDGRPGWKAATTAATRHVLVGLMADYQGRGLDALMQYADHPRPLDAGAEARAVVRASPSLLDEAPAVRDGILAFPATREGVEHDFYWSKERFGFKPTISLTHVVRQDRRSVEGGAFVLSSLQLYASHYFDASLGVTAIVSARGGRMPSHYMVYTNRTRNSRVGGALGPLIRAAAERRARSAMERLLAAIKVSEERLGR